MEAEIRRLTESKTSALDYDGLSTIQPEPEIDLMERDVGYLEASKSVDLPKCVFYETKEGLVMVIMLALSLCFMIILAFVLNKGQMNFRYERN